MPSLERNCPICKNVLTYKRKDALKFAEQKNSPCKSCSNKIKYSDPNQHPMFGKTHTDETKVKMSKSKLGKPHTTEHKKSVSNSKIGIKNSFYGKHHTEESKLKIRNSLIQSLKSKNLCYPNYNKDACKIIESFGKQHGYEFQHAENGGEFFVKELGYWVDGYDRRRNTVIEYYEYKSHRGSKKKEKDELRRKQIQVHLKCNFYVIHENGSIEKFDYIEEENP